MPKRTPSFAPVILLISLFLSSCGASSTNIHQPQTTLGQELNDLQEAYYNGAVTDEEYQRAKQLLFERYE